MRPFFQRQRLRPQPQIPSSHSSSTDNACGTDLLPNKPFGLLPVFRTPAKVNAAMRSAFAKGVKRCRLHVPYLHPARCENKAERLGGPPPFSVRAASTALAEVNR